LEKLVPWRAPMIPGQQLRAIREALGLTLKDVESASAVIAEKYNNQEYAIPASRLSEIETKGMLPSIYRVYSLALLYRKTVEEILSVFGIPLSNLAEDISVTHPPKSHILSVSDEKRMVEMPLRFDPGFDMRKTTNMGRMVEKWGTVPLHFLSKFARTHYTYGYVGTDDLTLYPLILPGSFLQIDESRNKIQEGGWRSEYERPIYFVETREGFVCTWCSLVGSQLVLQPHPLSPVPVRLLKHPQEGEVLGQVVGVAMSLGDSGSVELEQFLAKQQILNPGV